MIDSTIDLEKWCAEHRITEVECLVPDLSGIARGKILPAEKFLKGIKTDAHRLPESMFTQTVTGDFPETHGLVSVVDIDVVMRPDAATIRPVPWYTEPTAQVICDCVYPDDTPVNISARQVLREVLALYEKKGWKPVIAPEVEMYLVQKNIDPDLPLEPPVGRSGRAETSDGIAKNGFAVRFPEVDVATVRYLVSLFRRG